MKINFCIYKTIFMFLVLACLCDKADAQPLMASDIKWLTPHRRLLLLDSTPKSKKRKKIHLFKDPFSLPPPVKVPKYTTGIPIHYSEKEKPSEVIIPKVSDTPESQRNDNNDASDNTRLRLSAIFYNEDRPSAIINGDILHKGDTIQNMIMVSITRESVHLKSKKNIIILRLEKFKPKKKI